MTSKVVAASGQIGWFGKIPAVGDFVGRRLPATFREPWDRWLQQSLVHARTRFGEQWDALYLTFPAWRFLAPAGCFDAGSWSGLLLPSVDQVGRYYPLTLAESWPADAGAAPDAWLPGQLAADAASQEAGQPSLRFVAVIEERLAALARVIDPVLDGASVDDLERMLASLLAEVPFADSAGSSEPPGIAVEWSMPGNALASGAGKAGTACTGSRPLLFWQAAPPGQAIQCRLRPITPCTFIELVKADGFLPNDGIEDAD